MSNQWSEQIYSSKPEQESLFYCWTCWTCVQMKLYFIYGQLILVTVKMIKGTKITWWYLQGRCTRGKVGGSSPTAAPPKHLCPKLIACLFRSLQKKYITVNIILGYVNVVFIYYIYIVCIYYISFYIFFAEPFFFSVIPHTCVVWGIKCICGYFLTPHTGCGDSS